MLTLPLYGLMNFSDTFVIGKVLITNVNSICNNVNFNCYFSIKYILQCTRYFKREPQNFPFARRINNMRPE